MKAKIIIVIFFLSLSGITAKAQNLVPNGDFETYSLCPTALGQITRASGWHVSSLTPDYYNSCAGFGNNVYVPRNEIGYQKDCCGGGRMQVVICLIKMIITMVIEIIFTPN